MAKTVFAINGQRKQLSGRSAWALEKLIEAGFKGVTTIELPPGLRWSAYVMRLRKEGVQIGMVREKHSGPFSGQHGRYYLQSHIEIIRERARDREQV